MRNIYDLSYQQLAQELNALSEPAFRAAQIFDWLYKKNVRSFDDMRNLSVDLRGKLQEAFEIQHLTVDHHGRSSDETQKILFKLSDLEHIETVLIPTSTRATVCVSTQAGCKFGCRFCASGIGGWKRNLTPGEILAQVLHMKKIADGQGRPVSHIVFMGVGEPLDNYENLMSAIRVINDEKAINIGARRITVSTCGVIPKIHALAQEGLQIELAISLHGYDNESRDVLMPVNKKYPFDDLMDACREYIAKTKRQITFEYILIKDVTCSPQAIQSLKKAFKGLICKMNLIPYNPVSEFDHQTPSRQEMFAFKDQLETFGIHATIRAPRGRDVNAACGQLRHSTQK
ncbi:MAG: 23S rRNA (adenine(2503)-C(2))-methyltransferase RlmN [Candidatus Omnitrophica bacterium]|nr:23S rRNA (adenine(2503)-C(2))-methyltransferase RlmN [Candidatus Omnitrophota bacterium]